jgi:hypothetical protein
MSCDWNVETQNTVGTRPDAGGFKDWMTNVLRKPKRENKNKNIIGVASGPSAFAVGLGELERVEGEYGSLWHQEHHQAEELGGPSAAR